MTIPTVWLSCGVLRAELEELLRLGKIRGELLFLDSMLHMVPQQLETTLTDALERLGQKGQCLVGSVALGATAGVPNGVGETVGQAKRDACHSNPVGPMVLVYGDCCPRMLDLVRQYRVGRVDAINCAQMLVGRARYRELMREEAFLLLPEWALRWKDIFQIELGLTQEVAQDLMRENRGELVYLDTGLVPVPRETLAECATYTGLPLRVEPVSLEPLQEALLEAQAALVYASGGELS